MGKHEIAPTDSWSALTVPIVTANDGMSIIGCVLIIDPTKHNPLWKIPGGHKEPGETPLQTAIRETRGETGLHLHEAAFTEIPEGHKWEFNPTGHWLLLYTAEINLSDVKMLHQYDDGNEGEVAKYFTLHELQKLNSEGEILLRHIPQLRLVGTGI